MIHLWMLGYEYEEMLCKEGGTDDALDSFNNDVEETIQWILGMHGDPRFRDKCFDNMTDIQEGINNNIQDIKDYLKENNVDQDIDKDFYAGMEARLILYFNKI